MQTNYTTDEQPESLLAASSLVVAWLGLSAFVDRSLVPIALVAIVLSLLARWSARRHKLAGLHLANFSLALSCLVISATSLWCYVDYRLESTPGAMRLSFEDLAKQNLDLGELEGRTVTLKGYATFGDITMDEFQFTFDGDLKEPHQAVVVELPKGQSWKFEPTPLAITGPLERLNDSDSSPAKPKYVLRNAIVRPSRTPFGLAPRTHWNLC